MGRDLITVYNQGKTSIFKHPGATWDRALEGLGMSLEGGDVASGTGAPLFPLNQVLEKVSGRWNRLVLELAKHLRESPP